MVMNVDLSMMSQPLNLNDKDQEIAAQTRRLKIPLAGALCDLPKPMMMISSRPSPRTRMKTQPSRAGSECCAAKCLRNEPKWQS